MTKSMSRAAVVHLNLRAGSTFQVPVCTVSPRHSIGLAGTTRLTRSDFMLHIGADLLLSKGQRCVMSIQIDCTLLYLILRDQGVKLFKPINTLISERSNRKIFNHEFA